MQKTSHMVRDPRLPASDTHLPENQEPAFLRKLKAQFGGNNDGRQERPSARPKKPKNDDLDDEPTYVDEESQQTLTKAEYNELAGIKPAGVESTDEKDTPRGPDTENQPTIPENATGQPGTGEPRKEAIALIGSTASKRKAARIVGQEEDDMKIPSRVLNADQKKKSSKGKKVKLSFDEA